MEEKSLRFHGAIISYYIIGEGKKVLLLHGFGEDGSIWDNQVSALKKNFQLIVPDLPGSGKSGLIKNATIETYAEIIKAILDNEFSKTTGIISGSEKVSLIGHSMGGYVALAFAEKYPNYLLSLGLVHSTAFADSNEKKEIRKKAIGFIQKKGAYPFLKASIPGLFNETNASFNAPQIDILIEKGKLFTDDALVQYYEAMISRPERTGLFALINKPVLFIIGQHDNALPLQSSLLQCYLPNISHIHILKESGHMGMLEESERVNTILYDFFQFSE